MKTLRFPLLAAALVAALAACGTTNADGGSVDPSTADVTVTSADMAFSPAAVTALAGEAFTLALVNEDSMPHNVAIYTDSSRSTKLFAGELVTNAEVVYEVPALEAGTYFFDCELHPEMVGEMVAE